MADAFTVQNMDLYYGSFHALKNVNLNLASGEITAFIGPSGCGKSTFLKSLNRMNDLVEGCKITGDIRLMGEDIYDKRMDVSLLRRRVGMVFQKPNPFPMSVYDNIAYGPRTHGMRKKAELDEIVEKSLRDAAIWDELKDRLKKSALGLSGGQQQHRNRRRQMRQQRQRQRTDMVSISSHAFFPLLSTEKHRFISRMNTNSTTPVAISASRCSPAA